MIGIKKITVQHPTKLKDVEMGFYFLEYSPKPDVIEIDFGFFDGEKFNHLSTIKDLSVSKFKHFLKQNFYNPYALPNFEKAAESLKFSQRKINNESLAPTAELISDGMVSVDFVLEFAKILLSKK